MFSPFRAFWAFRVFGFSRFGVSSLGVFLFSFLFAFSHFRVLLVFAKEFPVLAFSCFSAFVFPKNSSPFLHFLRFCAFAFRFVRLLQQTSFLDKSSFRGHSKKYLPATHGL